jgi:D-tyrosyl-tRNA(Tyr) deacylase
MRAVVQRVTRAKVTVNDEIVGEIGNGLVVLLGIARDDTKLDAAYLAEKITALRICDDDEGKMNLSVKDVNGGVLVVSQFTLYGDVRRGLRPSWIEAAAPEVAEPLYEFFVRQMRAAVDEVATGSFRAMMQVELVNDGPVTILLDSKKLF